MLRNSVVSNCHYLCIKSILLLLATSNALRPTPSKVENKLENLESCTDEHGQPYVRVLPTTKHTAFRPDAMKGILLLSEELGKASNAKSEIKTLHAGLTQFFFKDSIRILKMCQRFKNVPTLRNYAILTAQIFKTVLT